ncbi:DUF1298 domain-containing protein [Pseudomaricurvus alcaniphilus]|uniref:wax ester/triacylglycerol synthase domain-containing protein n=1 Tax=Pseudomaricurvus alcaniphilus TaxID=1166482 RepID=UPI00140A1F3B|nr:wax ester/triacylglycerol synthase domain-containing protein [Pseudomaricurvus alcaniphilus]NHN36554.1 DUF1298 domain-containing protein [Pseudomaricurvus alcaniphilus]
MSVPISMQDYAWLMMETPETPMHFGAVILLTKPQIGTDEFADKLFSKLRDVNAIGEPWTWKINPDKKGLLSKHEWIVDNNFDVNYHIKRMLVPGEGHMEDVLELVTYINEKPLERARPLWELIMFDGLRDNKMAILIKVHHAFADGTRFMEYCSNWFYDSASVSVDDIEGFCQKNSLKRSQPKKKLTQASKFPNPAKVANLFSGTIKSAKDISYVLGREALRGFGVVKSRTPAFYTGPKTIVNEHVESTRVYAFVDAPFDRVRAIGKAVGGTVNDAVLAITAGAIRRLLLQNGSLPDEPMQLMMPVSLHGRTDEKNSESSEGGNQVSIINVDIATELSDSVQRLKRIVASTKQGKSDMEDLSLFAATFYTTFFQGISVGLRAAGLDRIMRPLSNISLSNVPGEQKIKYIGGARSDGLLPLSFLMHNNGLFVICNSTVNGLSFGFASSRSALPDLSDIKQFVTDELELLEQDLGLAVGAAPIKKVRTKDTTKS